MRSPRTRARTVASAPLDPARVAAELEKAVDQEQVLALLMRAARARAHSVALVTVHKDELLGRRSLAGAGPDESGLGELRVKRPAVPAFEEAIASGFPYVGPLLEVAPGCIVPTAMVLPVVVEDRTIALVIGHRGVDPISRDEVSDLSLIHI